MRAKAPATKDTTALCLHPSGVRHDRDLRSRTGAIREFWGPRTSIESIDRIELNYAASAVIDFNC